MAKDESCSVAMLSFFYDIEKVKNYCRQSMRAYVHARENIERGYLKS